MRFKTETTTSFNDQYFDLKSLAAYSSLGVGTLREYIKSGGLPHFRLKVKILVKRSEFDLWIEKYRCEFSKADLDAIVDEVMAKFKT